MSRALSNSACEFVPSRKTELYFGKHIFCALAIQHTEISIADHGFISLTAGTSLPVRKSVQESVIIPQGRPPKDTTLLDLGAPDKETPRSARSPSNFYKRLGRVISTESEASDRTKLCVKRFNLPPSIHRKLLHKALHVEEAKEYRTLEKLGDIAQQEVLYKIARDVRCNVDFMERVLKQSVGWNQHQDKRATKFGLGDCVFNLRSHDTIDPKKRLRLDKKKGLANSFEAVLGAVWEHNMTNKGMSITKLIELHKVMKAFDLDLDGALKAVLNQEVHVNNMPVEEAKQECRKCRQRLQEYESKHPSLAWWLLSGTRQSGDGRFQRILDCFQTPKIRLFGIFRRAVEFFSHRWT